MRRVLRVAVPCLVTILPASAGTARAQDRDDQGSGTYLTLAARSCPSYEAIRANEARNNIQESLRDLGAPTPYENGEPVEVTDDWYAQDRAGNIWYLGEDTAEYENGKVTSRAGSFEAGVDGAQPGIAMPANPKPGLSYRQEYYKGEAEDKAAVITVGEEQVQVPFGYFNKDVLMTRDLVPTEPKVQELKFYAPDVGPLLSIHTDGAGGRAALVSYTRGG